MLPKIVAAMLFFPFLTILSIGIGVVGAYMIITFNPSIMSMDDFLTGLRFDFEPLYIWYSLIKTVIFAFIITSISGYYGYYTKGNSLEVGRASTKAVVSSCITVLIFNLLITQLMLT
jgi:phospholipid/cholesterol/gamma-HCH transport system permease protein